MLSIDLPLGRRSAALALMLGAVAPVHALDHGESPLVSRSPKTDGTDLFVFRSYEAGREDFVTLIACYQPFQDPFAGPDYFLLDPSAVYEIHVDRDGDAREDLTFRFQFDNALRQSVTAPGQIPADKLPVLNVQPVSPVVDPPEISVLETYVVDLIRHDQGGTVTRLADVNGETVFTKPADAVGSRSFPDYPAYADAHVFELAAPAKLGRVFVGQRKDPRTIAMGQLFDLVDLNLTGPTSGGTDSLGGKNVTAIAIEVPVSLLGAAQKTIGVWSTAGLRQDRTLVEGADFDDIGPEAGPILQVSRIGAPLVGSLFIGMSEKDRFNTSAPVSDLQFTEFFTRPNFPKVVETQTGLAAPTLTPRTDLRQFYLTGIPGLNETPATAEMLRFRYSQPPIDAASQNALGVLGGDMSGFPNGRRPGDDVVDITLRMLMGARLRTANAPSGNLPLTDGVANDATRFDSTFPYLTDPLLGN